jgi:hypothetical protein
LPVGCTNTIALQIDEIRGSGRVCAPHAAIERRITVCEITYSNSISVSEHVVMMILALVRNYIPRISGSSRADGTSPTASPGRTTSKACKSGRSLLAGSVPLFSGG